MIVGCRQADLSILETAELLKFSHITISGVYRAWSEDEKIYNEPQFLDKKQNKFDTALS